jgi:hypothetical protein
MGSAAVRDQIWGAAPHDRAGVVEPPLRLSYGDLADADVVEADVLPVSEIERPDLLWGLRAFGLAADAFALMPYVALQGMLDGGPGLRFRREYHPSDLFGRNQNIRSAR